MIHTYSTEQISQKLIQELVDAIRSAGPYGSVEVFIQNNIVTQITMRNIKKTHHPRVGGRQGTARSQSAV